MHAFFVQSDLDLGWLFNVFACVKYEHPEMRVGRHDNVPGR